MTKKLHAVLLVVIFILGSYIPGFTLCEAEESKNADYVLLDLSDSSDIALLGMDEDYQNCLFASSNATFKPSQISMVNSSGHSTAASSVVATEKNGIITDWSSYTNYNIWIYSEKVTDQKFALVVRDSENRICANIMERNFSGWKKFSIPFSSFTNKNSAFDRSDIKDFYISLSYGDMKNNAVGQNYTKLTFAKIWLSRETRPDYTELFSSTQTSATKSMFSRSNYAKLEADGANQVLHLSGNGTNDAESATPLLDTAMDWTGYNYLNFRVRNIDPSDSKFHFYATVSGKNAAAATGYWRKQNINISGNTWYTISLAIPESFEFTKNASTPVVYDTMSHIEALRFDYIKGNIYVEKIWLSKNQPINKDFSISEASLADGSQNTDPNLKSIEFSYTQRLIPDIDSKYVSIRDVSNSTEITDGFEVGSFGNKLQILFTEKLNYETEYMINVSKDIYGSPVPFASSGACIRFTTAKASSDAEAIKDRWKKSIVGDAFNNESHSYVTYYIKQADSAAKAALDSMNTSNPNLPPWGEALSESADMTNQFANIETIAIAYAMKGSVYYKDDSTFSKIIYALEWMYQNAYGIDEMNNSGWRDTKLHNWWDWQIGSPVSLTNTLILLEDKLNDEFIQNEIKVIEHFVPVTKDYGSNLIYFAKIMIGSALLTNNTQRLKNAVSALENEFDYESLQNGQGFHADGTYLFHTKHFHNGSYGVNHFMLLLEIASFVKGTSYEFNLNLVDNLFEIYKNSFEPLIYDGAMISLANGRSPSDSYTKASNIMEAILNMVVLFRESPVEYENELSELKSILKKYYSDPNSLRKLPIRQAEFANGIVCDEAVSPKADIHITKIYTDGDKAIHHTDSFTAAVAMSSSRVYNYESINAQNMNGWYMADGMQYIYMDNDVQYKSDWWKRSDPYKRPGTTVDTQKRQEVSIKQGNEYLSSKDFVGGASLGNTGVVAMDLESYHNEKGGTTTNTGNGASAPLHSCSLTVKKAWFMFDDEVVSLGCDINANDGFEVRTIIDNRKMMSGGVVADGSNASEGTFDNTGYLNFEDRLGYVFPNTENITLNINDSNPDFTEAWISHGVSPCEKSYSYITLPGMNTEQTKRYADSPDITILSNSPSVQAVYDKSTSATGYVFRKPESINGIKAETPCTLIIKPDSKRSAVSVSDPTHKLDSVVLTFENTILIPDTAYSKISFRNSNGNTIVTVDTSDHSGRSYEFTCLTSPSDETGIYAGNVGISQTASGAFADITLLNPTNIRDEAIFILAVYDKAGLILKDVIFKKVSVEPMQTSCETLAIDETEPFTAKVFVWKSFSNPKNLPIYDIE